LKLEKWALIAEIVGDMGHVDALSFIAASLDVEEL